MRGITRYFKIFYVCLLITLSLAVYLVYGSVSTESGFYNNFQIEKWNEGWFLEGTEQKVTLPVKLNDSKEEYTSIFRYLEEDTKEDYICFRTDHSFVRVYADDELIYTFGDGDKILLGKTPGSIWNIIPIHNLEAGTKLTVSVMCPYTMYAGKYREMMKGSRADVLLYIFKDSAPLILMTIIPMIVAAFLVVVHLCFRKEFASMIFLNAGGCYLLLAIWSFTETRGWQFFFSNAYIMQMINFISFSLVIATILVVMKQMGFINNRRHFNVLLFVDVAIPGLQIIIQLLEITDFFEMLFVIHILDAVNIFVFTTDFIVAFYKKKKSTKNLMLVITMYVSVFSCFVLDLMDFYVWDKFGNGFFSRIELLIIISAAGISAVKKAVSMYAENIEKNTYLKMAFTDDMTGMKNRRAFDSDTETLAKEKDGVAILYADMNNLKQINDTMGHQKGDEAIRIIADKLKCFSEKGNFCYRLGGDEFCVISTNLTAENMEIECARINQELAEMEHNFICEISIAYGAMDYKPENNDKLYEIMRRADKKMYEKKQEMKIESDSCNSTEN